MSQIEPTVFKANWLLQTFIGFVCLAAAMLLYEIAKDLLVCPVGVPKEFQPPRCRLTKDLYAMYVAVAFLGLGALAMAFSLLLDRPVVTFDQHGVWIRHLLYGASFSWSDVAGFERRDIRQGIFRLRVASFEIVRLKNGKQIALPNMMQDPEKLLAQLKLAWLQAVPL